MLDVGYATDVMKFGGYATWVGPASQRDTLGYVLVRNAGLIAETYRDVRLLSGLISRFR